MYYHSTADLHPLVHILAGELGSSIRVMRRCHESRAEEYPIGVLQEYRAGSGEPSFEMISHGRLALSRFAGAIS